MAARERVEPDQRDASDRAYAARDRRFWAAIIDLWVLPLVLSVLLSVGSLVDWSLSQWELEGRAIAWLLTFVVLVSSEAVFAQSPGKKLLGLRVIKLDASTPGWREALLRRSWLAPTLFDVVPGFPEWVGFWLIVAIVITLLVSIRRDPDNRGWHDRLAGTDVVPVASWAQRSRRGSHPGEEPSAT